MVVRLLIRSVAALLLLVAAAVIAFSVWARLIVGGLNVAVAPAVSDHAQVLGNLDVPPGFELRMFGEVRGARVLRFTAGGDLLVSQPRLGRISLLRRDRDGDGFNDGSQVLLDGLTEPNGLDFVTVAGVEYLYVAESDALGRVPFDAAAGTLAGDYERLVTGLPNNGAHRIKNLRLGPDGWLYVSVGSSCNVCLEDDVRRATLLRYRIDGSHETVVASGLRNTVGFDWNPADGHLYGTDNGRDMLGDDFPPCELNLLQLGGFYGWPHVNGFGVPDPDFGTTDAAPDAARKIANARSPLHGFRAHNAPLGIHFYRGDGFPPVYRGAAFVALHGSWNRSSKDGYKVVSLHFAADGSIEERDFVTGFLRGNTVHGRPTELAQGPDGALYVADDHAGLIYRIAWVGSARRSAFGRPSRIVLPEPSVPPASSPPAATFDPAATLAALPAPLRAELLAEGEELFNRHACLGCHGMADDMYSLAGVGRRHDLDSLVAYLRQPKAPMPPPPVGDTGRRALAAWLIKTYD